MNFNILSKAFYQASARYSVTEGEGFCRRRKERKAEEQVKKDLANLDKIVILESKAKPRN